MNTNQKSAPAIATIRTGSNSADLVGSGRDSLFLFGLIGVAIAFRVHGLTAANLWLDEANSWLVSSGSWSSMAGELRGSPVGPLYFVLLKLWIVAFGDSAFTLRSLSVVSSLALIPAVYALGARILSRHAGLLAAALVALSPLELYFAQEARMYMLTSLTAVLCLWAYASWRAAAVERLAVAAPASTAARRSPLAWYVLAAVTLLLTHPVAGTLLIAINFDALAVWWRSRSREEGAAPDRERTRAAAAWIGAQLVVLAIIALYAHFLHLDTAASTQAWREALGLERASRATLLLPFDALFGPRYFPSNFSSTLTELLHGGGSLGRTLLVFIIEPVLLLVFVLAGDAMLRERWARRFAPDGTTTVLSGRGLLLLALVIPLIVGTLISISRALEMPRYFLFVVPFLFLLLADGLLALPRAIRVASLVSIAGAYIGGTIVVKGDISRDSDYRSTAVLLAHESRPGDRIMIQPREMSGPLRFYLRPNGTPIIGLAADASAGQEIAGLPPGRTWVVIDYRSPLYTLAPRELEAALRSPLERDAYTSDASVGVRVALVDTRTAEK